MLGLLEDQIDNAECNEKPDDENDADDPKQKFDHEALLLAEDNAWGGGWVPASGGYWAGLVPSLHSFNLNIA